MFSNQKLQKFKTAALAYMEVQLALIWTVVLEKTLKSPLDCKKIQPVHPKRNQSWVFIGRTDAEAEVPILWGHERQAMKMLLLYSRHYVKVLSI